MSARKGLTLQFKPFFQIPPRLAEPRESVCGKNSWGHNRYGGPCPPSGTHHYEFRLYALDTTLELSGSASREQLGEAMDQHIIAVALRTGLYEKKGASS